MKKIKNILLIITITLFSAGQSFSQFDQVGDMIQAGTTDANKFLNAYLEPLGKGLGYTLAGGWYNNAKTHRTLGFDLTFSFNIATFPEEAKTFDINSLDLQRIKPSNSGNTIFPTLINGNTDNSIIIDLPEFEGETVSLDPITIKGQTMPFVPLPTLNGSIGIIKNTDIAFRFIPTVKLGDFGDIGLWGLGVKHDVLQWLPIVDKVPFLNASVFLGYSRLSYNYDNISYEPQVDHLNGYVNPNNQRLEAGLGAFHGALLVGVNLPVVSPYISLGITNSVMNIDVLGEYAIPEVRENNDGALETYINPDSILNDPLKVDIKNTFSPSAAVGLRVKLAVVTFHGQYTYQEYGMITAGLGISFR